MSSAIVVFVIPGVSHITPLVPILRHFGKQGYSVRVYAASYIASYVEKAGAELVSLDELYDQLEGDPYARTTSPFAMLELLKLMEKRSAAIRLLSHWWTPIRSGAVCLPESTGSR